MRTENRITRRHALGVLGGLGAAAALPGCARTRSTFQSAAGEVGLVDNTDHDIARFDPARFMEGGSPDEPAVTADPAAAPR